MKRKTNVQFLTQLMNYSSNGALMQLFILDACLKQAEYVIENIDTMNPNGLVNPEAWLSCAQELKTKLNEHLGRKS